MKKIYRKCKNCRLSEWNYDGSFSSCALGEKPSINCTAVVVKRRPEICSSCGEETDDWDYVGQGDDKRVQCRGCMCGDWIPFYRPGRESVLYRCSEKCMPVEGVNTVKFKAQMKRRQIKHGISNVVLDGGVSK